ncbi:ATP-dependent (S)-NAD(P)H-hydrate dehydratase [Drosophila guanche]|uniref:ATP-dependent (S)-NAD(P)H-hydrate dehydratase n=1 Tax=Drosophila guanche TaxID=7266 RepID=A0A3B0JWY2_DROGU|nr:ATP-dependent (S)-NAD(P)H-hydrate dehydratase [Drosophila guanche]SPP85583.1 blast:ATP-dependent (S)-NAD(P)H-hydrate dehydratase [Drosophila guanche]
MSTIKEIPVHLPKLLTLFRTIVPKLTNDKYKGQYGRIGVIGGSLEYTGAPYFAALSSMKVGADLAHVFCQANAASVIKSYSPDLIVHPVLDCLDAVDKIKPWLDRLHVIVIGPGLGREPPILKTAKDLLKLCIELQKPIVIDADGLFILNDNIDLVCGQRNIILTPNAMEFRRLFGEDTDSVHRKMSSLGDGVVVLEKGICDRIHIPHTNEVHSMPSGGSGRRCGGQGDLLSGSLATFYFWSLQANQPNPALIAACASSYLVKGANLAAFKKFGRSLLASDMINEISTVFRSEFEDPEG